MDHLNLERAGRIVAPISDHIDQDYFEGGARAILSLLGHADISVRALSAPPFLGKTDAVPLSKEWFAELSNRHQRVPDCPDWAWKYLEWAKCSLLVDHDGVVKNLEHVFRVTPVPLEHVTAAGVSWSFPQALAWIATRDSLEVARIEYAKFWGTPYDVPQEVSSPKEDWISSLFSGERVRRKLIGWLVLQTSLKCHECKQEDESPVNREPWETCQCVGEAYDELRLFASDKGHPIPEYRPEPFGASFTLTWPEGAAKLRFARADMIERWPAKSDQISDHEVTRTSSVRALLPSRERILAKADEMKARGMDGRTLAAKMHEEPGFENVQVTDVRSQILGRYKRGAPPKKRT